MGNGPTWSATNRRYQPRNVRIVRVLRAFWCFSTRGNRLHPPVSGGRIPPHGYSYPYYSYYPGYAYKPYFFHRPHFVYPYHFKRYGWWNYRNHY